MTTNATVARTRIRVWQSLLLAVGGVSAATGTAATQPCNGTPAGHSAQYQYEALGVGSAQSISGTLVGGKVALGLDARLRQISTGVSGYGGMLRVSGLIGSRLQFCPGLALGANRDQIELPRGGTLTASPLMARAGLGMGISQPLFGDLSVIPFARVDYGFNLTVYQLSGVAGSNSVTGDTLSGIAIDYGLMLHWRTLYGGYSASRLPGQDGTAPGIARFVLGVTAAVPQKR